MPALAYPTSTSYPTSSTYPSSATGTSGTENPLLPTLTDVVRIIRARVTDDVGQAEIFGPHTAVSPDQALSYIEAAADDVLLKVGITLPDGPTGDIELYRRTRKRLIARKAAMDIELAMFPQRATQDADYYDRLLARFDTSVETLVEAVQDAGEGGDPGEVDDRAEPLGSFPEPCVRFDSEPF